MHRAELNPAVHRRRLEGAEHLLDQGKFGLVPCCDVACALNISSKIMFWGRSENPER